MSAIVFGRRARGRPSGLPAWLDGSALNEWVSISGTTGAGGAAVDAFSGFAVRGSELWCLACGGHGDSADNRVTSIDLSVDSPAWSTEKASDWNGSEQDVSHYASGSPASRHTYTHNHWMPTLNRFVLAGCRSAYGTSTNYTNVDGFNPDAGTWDAASTLDPLPVAGVYGVVKDGEGNIWTPGFRKYSAAGVWSAPSVTGSTAPSIRHPAAYDSLRNEIVWLQWGDNFGFSGATNCTRFDLDTLARQQITINASAAKTQFEADAPQQAGMAYDPVSGKYLFFDGRTGKQNRFYWLTPADGTTWDMEIASFGGATIPVVGTGGTNGKLQYVAALNGFVLMATSATGLYFLRTA